MIGINRSLENDLNREISKVKQDKPAKREPAQIVRIERDNAELISDGFSEYLNRDDADNNSIYYHDYENPHNLSSLELQPSVSPENKARDRAIMEKVYDINQKNQGKHTKEWRFGQAHLKDEIDNADVPEITTKAHLAKGMRDFTGGKMGIMFSIREEASLKDWQNLKKASAAEKQAQQQEVIMKSRLLKLQRDKQRAEKKIQNSVKKLETIIEIDTSKELIQQRKAQREIDQQEQAEIKKLQIQQLREQRWASIMQSNLNQLGEKSVVTLQVKQTRKDREMTKQINESLELQSKKNTVSNIRLFESHVLDTVNKTKIGIAIRAREQVNGLKGKDVYLYNERTEEHKKSIQSMAGMEGQLIKELQQTTQKQQVLAQILNNRNSRRISINLTPQLSHPQLQNILQTRDLGVNKSVNVRSVSQLHQNDDITGGHSWKVPLFAAQRRKQQESRPNFVMN